MNDKTAKRPLSVFLLIFIIMAMLTGAGLWFWRDHQHRRVDRSHVQTVAEEVEYLTKGFDFHPPYNPRQSRTQAQEDLDELEWLLDNRYSYLHLKDVNYKAALDSIRCSLGDGIHRSSFGYQLSKFIALFGDGHSYVASPSCRWQSLCMGFPPFLVEESNGRLVVFKPDRSDFVDSNTPFLRAINGLPVDSWLKVAGQLIAMVQNRTRSYRSFYRNV